MPISPGSIEYLRDVDEINDNTLLQESEVRTNCPILLNPTSWESEKFLVQTPVCCSAKLTSLPNFSMVEKLGHMIVKKDHVKTEITQTGSARVACAIVLVSFSRCHMKDVGNSRGLILLYKNTSFFSGDSPLKLVQFLVLEVCGRFQSP